MSLSDARFRDALDTRYAVLDALAASPARKPELVADLDVSRSTVDRAIDDLTEAACVTSENGAYRLTTAGELALAEHERYRDTTGSINEAARLVNHLPTDAPLDASLVTDASVTYASEHAPDAALEPSDELLADATALRGLAPVVFRTYPATIEAELARRDEALDVEIVAEREVVAALGDLTNAGVESLLDRDAVTLLEAEESLPYSLWIMDTTDGAVAGVTVHDGGGFAGVLMNDDSDAVAWAREQYERYRTGAAVIDPDEAVF